MGKKIIDWKYGPFVGGSSDQADKAMREITEEIAKKRDNERKNNKKK